MAPPRAPAPGRIINAHAFLDTLDEVECCICEEPYSDTHAPVITPTCHHVFGSRCLRAWALSINRAHNRCPLCRAVLFDDGLPLVEEDARPGDNAIHRVDEPVWTRAGLARGGEDRFQAQRERLPRPQHIFRQEPQHIFHQEPQHIFHQEPQHIPLFPPLPHPIDPQAGNQHEAIIRGAVNDRVRAQGPLLAAPRPYPFTGVPNHPPVPIVDRIQPAQHAQWVNWTNYTRAPLHPFARHFDAEEELDQNAGPMARPYNSVAAELHPGANEHIGTGPPRRPWAALPMPLPPHGLDVHDEAFQTARPNIRHMQQPQPVSGVRNAAPSFPPWVPLRVPGPPQGGQGFRDRAADARDLPQWDHHHGNMDGQAQHAERAAGMHYPSFATLSEAQRRQQEVEAAAVAAQAAAENPRQQQHERQARLRAQSDHPDNRVRGALANAEPARAPVAERLVDETPALAHSQPRIPGITIDSINGSVHVGQLRYFPRLPNGLPLLRYLEVPHAGVDGLQRADLHGHWPFQYPAQAVPPTAAQTRAVVQRGLQFVAALQELPEGEEKARIRADREM